MAEIKVEKEKSTTTLVIETIASLMTAAFAFVAALAWNTAIQAGLEQVLGSGNTVVAQFVYAILITIIAVIAIVYIGRVLARYKAMDAKK